MKLNATEQAEVREQPRHKLIYRALIRHHQAQESNARKAAISTIAYFERKMWMGLMDKRQLVAELNNLKALQHRMAAFQVSPDHVKLAIVLVRATVATKYGVAL